MISFCLLLQTPFNSGDRLELYRTILKCTFKMPSHLSLRARSLLYMVSRMYCTHSYPVILINSKRGKACETCVGSCDRTVGCVGLCDRTVECVGSCDRTVECVRSCDRTVECVRSCDRTVGCVRSCPMVRYSDSLLFEQFKKCCFFSIE